MNRMFTGPFFFTCCIFPGRAFFQGFNFHRDFSLVDFFLCRTGKILFFLAVTSMSPCLKEVFMSLLQHKKCFTWSLRNGKLLGCLTFVIQKFALRHTNPPQLNRYAGIFSLYFQQVSKILHKYDTKGLDIAFTLAIASGRIYIFPGVRFVSGVEHFRLGGGSSVVHGWWVLGCISSLGAVRAPWDLGVWLGSGGY